MANKTKICVICSAGGHLSEALAAIANVKEPYFFITHKEGHVTSRLEGLETYFVVDPHISPLRYLVNALQSLWIFLKKRPRLVISTGSGIAIATCLLCKLTGGAVVYVESGAQVSNPSRTGRLIYLISDLFIVQSKALLVHYPKAVYGGLLI